MNNKSNPNRLGKEPVKKLLLQLSIPATIGLIVGSSYNLVDTIFIGRLGVVAISSLSIVFPIQIILTSIATGLGIGSQSLISRLIGKKHKKEASQAAGNSIILAAIFGILVTIIGLLFSKDIIRLFSSDPTIINLGTAYIRIILLGSFSLFYLRACLNILRAQGNYLLPMFVLIITASLNIFLDPILIFGLWKFPALGVEGAAIATVASRTIACLFITVILLSKRNEVDLTFKGFVLDKKIIRNISLVGVPTIMIQLVMSITIAGTNKILEGLPLNTVYIAIVGIYFKLQSFILTPVLGLNRSFVPIIGYNYSAKNYDRIKEVVKIAMMFSLSISFIAFLFFQIFPGELIKLFSSDSILVDTGIDAFRRMNIIFFVVGPSIIVISFFQGIGKATKLVVALATRQFIVFFPVLYLLTVQSGHPNLWFAFPIADAVAILVGIIFTYPEFKKLGIIDMLFARKP